MKSFFLSVALLSATTMAGAAPCSPTSSGPCSPDKEGQAYADILALIAEAQSAEEDVKDKYNAYFEMRDLKVIPASARLATFELYRAAKMGQDALYERAINDTAKLYHVAPKHSGPITIGEPDEPDDHYMTGLTAIWKPQVTDSGPGVKLAVRVDGNDGPHYSGGTNLDPNQPKGRYAVTLPDGRVLIMKDTFAIAADVKENLGFLAAVIYHETRHYNKLSWTDKTGKNRSWGTDDEEERDAYGAQARMGRIFGLSGDDIRKLEGQARAHAIAVKTGVAVNDFKLTAGQKATWENHYNHKQINLAEEFEALQSEAKDELAQQLKEQEREREERQLRQAESDAQEARRRREAIDDLEAVAASCGYALSFQGGNGKFLGFQGKADREYLHLRSDHQIDLNMNDMKVGLLIARACHEVEFNTERATPRPCISPAPYTYVTVRKPDFADKFQYFFGARQHRNACLNTFFDRANEISDVASFDKLIAQYHKQLRIANRKRWEKSEQENRRTAPPRGGESPRPPSQGDNKDYFLDPDCNCWIRRY